MKINRLSLLTLFMCIASYMCVANASNNKTTLMLTKFKEQSGWSLRADFLQMLKSLFKINVFIETGSYYGDTTENALCFDQVHTIELSVGLYGKVKDRFKKNKKVHVYHGDSSIVLPTILRDVKGKILFWLDGAYNEGPTAKGAANSSVLGDLEAIKKSGVKDSIIMIDDVRCFQAFNYSPVESVADYPSVQKLKERILDINPNYKFVVYGDLAIAFPGNEKINVSPFIEACTISRLFDDANPQELKAVLEAEKIIAQVKDSEKKELDALYEMFGKDQWGLGNQFKFWHALTLINRSSYSEANDELASIFVNCPHSLRLQYYLDFLESNLTLLDSSARDSKGFTIITTLYNEKDERRIKEYITCLENNLKHPLIRKIHVLYDTLKDDKKNKVFEYLKSKKIKLSYIKGRPTYGSIFELANKEYPKQKIIVCNADVYFNNTLQLLRDYDLSNKFIALTRWNVLANGSLSLFKQYDHNGNFRPDWTYYSQDAWIFKTPIKKFENAAIPLGTLYCDGMIAYQADKAGLDAFNPCHSIQCCHLHLSEVRNYDRPSTPPGPMKPLIFTSLNRAINAQEDPITYELQGDDYKYFKMYY